MGYVKKGRVVKMSEETVNALILKALEQIEEFLTNNTTNFNQPDLMSLRITILELKEKVGIK